jgi:hypothetical protein
MEGNQSNTNGYDDSDGDYREHILQLCKLAQGNITTIYWCKQQIRKRLKVLDRLVERIGRAKKSSADSNDIERIERVVKRQTDACKELGDKIESEIESLDAIRIAAKSYGIDIKSRLLELDYSLDGDDIYPFFENPPKDEK